MMKDKPGPPAASWQLEQARQLLAQGHSQKALTIALDVLVQELNQLRSALWALQRLTRNPRPPQAAATPADSFSEDSPWPAASRPRILH